MNADQGDIGRRRRANGCGLDEPAIRLSDGQLLAFLAILTQAGHGSPRTIATLCPDRDPTASAFIPLIGVHPSAKKNLNGRTRAVAAGKGLPSTPLFGYDDAVLLSLQVCAISPSSWFGVSGPPVPAHVATNGPDKPCHEIRGLTEDSPIVGRRLSSTFRNFPARAALPYPIEYPRRRSAGAGPATLAVMEFTRVPASGDTVVNAAGRNNGA